MATLHTDIPTRAQVTQHLHARGPASVSIYLATDPASDGEAERIEAKNLLGQALDQLRDAGTDRADVDAVGGQVTDLLDDVPFWRHQARSLAVFATPTSLTTFRLPNRLGSQVAVSDRFHLKPLLRTVTFPQAAFVLALAQGSVRLLELLPDAEPRVVEVPDLPTDLESAVGQASPADRTPSARLVGDEGAKVRARQFARRVDSALRPLLAGADLPLILAATEPLDSMFRATCTYPHLAPTTLAGNPDGASDAELGARARTVLDELYAAELAEVHQRFEAWSSQGRTAADVAEVARLATWGAVDTVLVDIDASVPGTVDDETGAVTFEDADDAVAYGVVDEIARRVWSAGGRVLAVRAEEVPGGTPVAALLRYTP